VFSRADLREPEYEPTAATALDYPEGGDHVVDLVARKPTDFEHDVGRAHRGEAAPNFANHDGDAVPRRAQDVDHLHDARGRAPFVGVLRLGGERDDEVRVFAMVVADLA
jgi:hypothetical protein